MAYEVIDPRQREEDEAPEGVAQATPMAPPPALGSVPNAPAYARAETGAEVPGSKFVNFDRVLNANREVAERESSALAGRLGQAGEDARSKLTGVTSSFNAAVNAGTPLAADRAIKPMPASAMTGVVGGPAGMASGTRPAPLQRPPQTLGVPGPTTSAAAAAAQAGAVYGGPTDFTKFAGFDDALSANRKAVEGLALTNTPGGLQTLAQQQAGGPLTQGQSQMDAALLGATGGKKFADVRERFKDLDTAIERASADAGATVGRAQDSAQATADYYQREGRLLKEKEDKVAADQAAADAAQAQKDAEYKEGEYRAWETDMLKEMSASDVGAPPDHSSSSGHGSHADNMKHLWMQTSDADKRKVFSSFTSEELTAFRNMPFLQRMEMIMTKLTQLRDKK